MMRKKERIMGKIMERLKNNKTVNLIKTAFISFTLLLSSIPLSSVADVNTNPAVTPGNIYNFDAESGLAGWQTDGLWHITTNRYNSPTHSFWYGDENTKTYNTGGANSGNLMSPVITLASGSQPVLYFWSWYQTENNKAYDKKVVQISVNDGQWTDLKLITDAKKTWNKEIIDLSSYAGNTIRLRFLFDTIDNNLNSYEGWYVDDIQITSDAISTATPTPTPTPAPTPTYTTVTLTAVNDTSIKSGLPDLVRGSFTWVDLGRLTGSTYGNYHGLLYFDLSTIPSTATINNVNLTLVWESDNRNQTTVIDVFRPSSVWDPLYATWNSRLKGVLWTTPGGDWIDKNGVSYGNTPYAEVIYPIGSRANADFDVTTLIQEYVSGKYPNNGFFLKANEISDSYLAFYSSNWSNESQRPKLVINYTSAAPTPIATATPTPIATPISTSTPTPTPSPSPTPCTNICYVSTDNTADYYANGIHDEATINQAISKVAGYSNSTNPGKVHINAGTYNLLGVINHRSYVTLEGDGIDQTILKLQYGVPSLTDTAMIIINSTTTNANVQDMTIDGNKTGLPYIGDSTVKWYGITVKGNNFVFKNLNINNTKEGGINDMGGNNGIIANVGIYNPAHYSMYLSNGKNYTITDIISDNDGNSGVRLENVSDVYIGNLTVTNFHNWGIQLYHAGTTNRNINNVTFENFTIKKQKPDRPLNGIYIAQINHIDKKWHITNVTFRNGIIDTNYEHDYADEIDADNRYDAGGISIKNADYITFDNVVIHNSSGDSIIAINGLNGDQGSKVSHITVKNSALVNSTGYGINSTGNITWNVIYNDLWNNYQGNYNSIGNYGGSIIAGAGNLYVAPLFANPSLYDFHLKSQTGRWTGTAWVKDTVTSSLIDAGDPASDYSKEPAPNGYKINIDAYGDTPEASLS